MTKPAWHPSGQWTIARFISVRVFELALHGWDIHISLDPNARIRDQLQPFLVHFLLQTGKRAFEGGPELDGVYRFELQGSFAWTTKVFNGKMDHGPLEPNPDAIVRSDASCFLLLSTGRKTLPHLQERGLLTIEGEQKRAEELIKAICRPA